MRNEALARGIRPEIVDQAPSSIDEPLATVIERDRTQAETVLSLEKYVALRLTPKRIRTGREMMPTQSPAPQQPVVKVWRRTETGEAPRWQGATTENRGPRRA